MFQLSEVMKLILTNNNKGEVKIKKENIINNLFSNIHQQQQWELHVVRLTVKVRSIRNSQVRQ